jgi:hypothetical protein
MYKLISDIFGLSVGPRLALVRWKLPGEPLHILGLEAIT